MCKAGYKEIAWFVLLLPIILFFVMFGSFSSKRMNLRIELIYIFIKYIYE